MPDGELDRLDAREIGRVQRMLPPGPRLHLLPEHARQRVVDRIERCYRWQADRTAARFERAADLRIDQGEDHQPRILRDLAEDTLEMSVSAYHRPEMAQHLDIIELRQRRLGDILQRLTGGIGEQMKMKTHQLDRSVENMRKIASATTRARQAARSIHDQANSSTTRSTWVRMHAQPVDDVDDIRDSAANRGRFRRQSVGRIGMNA